MSKRTVVPFGPQHPVLPEPVHLDLVLEDETVVNAIPRIGYVHRGLEKLVEKRDYTQFVYVTERICGICSFGHSLGYSECVEQLMGIEVTDRAAYLRVIFSACDVGGFRQEVSNETLAGIVVKLERLRDEYRTIAKTLLEDTSVKSRMVGVGHISTEKALELSMVGPFARASNVVTDERLNGIGAYGDLAAFEPVLSDGGDCYARCDVRVREVLQSIDIISELVDKIPDGEVMVPVKGNPADGAQSMTTLEQPRGQAFYYSKGNGTKNLARMRVRTPTSQNIAGMVAALANVELADVPMVILTIDPCISCTER